MIDGGAESRPLTSVQLLDAALWREIGSEEAQPRSPQQDPEAHKSKS